MSTVQNLLDYMQFRVDVANTGLYPLINNACRQIARRLNILESAIVKKEMAITLYHAPEDYTASLVFVDGGSNADTITDAAAQFAIQGFIAGMYITTSDTNSPGPYRLTTVTAGTLTVPSGSLTAAIAASVTITGLTGYSDLPADFGGLLSEPYLVGYQYPLVPLPSVNEKLLFTSPGIPNWYEIKGNHFHVYPPPSSDYVIVADYQAVPVTLTAASDTMPFYGLFDDAICESIMRTYRSGEQIIGQDTRWWDQFCTEQVDVIAARYGKSSPPPPRTNGINWGRI